MASRPDQVAPVKWWSANRITVQCPYCTKTHGHGFPRPGNDGVKYDEFWRQSDCSGGGRYLVAFPFDEAKSVAGYEINKQEGTYVSARFLTDEATNEARSVAGTRSNREERPKFKDGYKLPVTDEFDGQQITYQRCFVNEAVSRCVCGDVVEVEKYITGLRGHNDYDIFLRGEDDNGYTALGLAAMETEPDMVALLLRHGCDVNACSHSGRTPLMEAALWGRSENVKILLKHGADKTMHDHNGKLAIDLAQICEENEDERHHRVPNFPEVPYLARKARREIIRLLELPVTPDQVFGFDTLGTQGQGRHFAVQPDNSIALVTPIEQLASTHISAEGWKEVAVMDRGGQFPHVTASSREANGSTKVTVSGQSWSDLVSRVAKCVEFTLLSIPNQKNNSSDLCSMNHPEMHLVAYFIDKHVILPDEVVGERELEDLVEWRYNQASDDEEMAGVKRAIVVTQLSQVKPPLSLLTATIVASTPACFDCKEFCKRVNAFFGLHLRLQYPHQREDTDASVSELSLEDFAASCREMHEAENLCRSVLSRLTICLDGVTVIRQPRRYLSMASETPSAKAIAARFDEVLRRFSGNLVAWRFATARSLVDELLQIQGQLDKISTDPSQWRAQWRDEVESMKTQLRSIVEEGATSVHDDLSKAPTMLLDEAMILLAHEIKTHMKEPFFSTEELRLVLDGITGMTRSVAPVVEAWFVPRHEVFYNDEKPFGSGSFAKVYRGKWHETEVIVKCVNITSDNEMRTFRREVRIWNKISHKHIVRFFRACDVGSPCFMLCERATEGTLRTYLYKQRKEGRLLAWRKLHEAALGLLFLHREGTIHGDLKNDNILVGGDGKAMLSDFGLSIDESGSRAVVEKWGAIRYRAPEQVVGLDGRSFAADVYSLGMCIVEAVTGRMPWGDVPDSAVAVHLRNQEMLKKPKELDENAWELVTSMTSFDPVKRISLESVVKRLEEFALQEEERECEARMAP